MRIEYYFNTFIFFIISFIYHCNGFLTEYRNHGSMKTASFTTVFARRGRKNNTKNNNNVTVKKKRKRSNNGENNDVTIDNENIPIRKVFSYASLIKRKVPISLIPKLVHITDKNYDQQRQQVEQQHRPKSSSCDNFTTRVSVYEINDPKWWSDSNANANPFGARLWPSSLGLSQFLVNFASLKKDDGMKIPMLNQYNILEVGSGTALPSIVAATLLTQHGEKGGEVIASDIDSTVLQLAMDGWTNTLKSIKKKDKDNTFSTVSFKCIPFDITKSPKNFRLFLSENFATEEEEERQKPTLILGTALFYDNTLAKKMAHVVVNEALSINNKSWIVIGNDDSSNRDGDGKLIFLQELKSLIPNITIIESNPNSVQQEKLGWQEKQVKLMHINPPIDDDGGISESLLRCL